MDAKATNAISTVYPSTPPYSKGTRSSHQYFSLRWNNYQSNMTSVFHELLETQSFVDVTLACEYNSLKAHKVVLSACSAYFQKILLDNPCKHPTIILPSDICFSDLQFIIEFVYRGEIDVSEAELQQTPSVKKDKKQTNLEETMAQAEQLSVLVHRRGLAKGKLTRLFNYLFPDEEEAPQLSEAQVRHYVKKVEAVQREYTEVHERILALVPEDNREDHDSHYVQFDDLQDVISVNLEEQLAKVSLNTATSRATFANTQAQAPILVHQPLKIPISTFDGRYESWPKFKVMFKDLVDNTPDPPAVKLYHLDKALTGSASGIIDAKTISEGNYIHAWEILEESSRSPDSRHPPPPSGSQPLSNTRNAHSSSSQINNNQSGQDSKSGHNSSSSGRNHNSNLETVVSDDGSSPIVVLESHDLTSTPGKEGKTKMTSLGMGVGINGSVMGVPMGYLDFAPEPPAPTATPVTEHHDISCAPSHDTRDLSNPQDAIQLDNQVAHPMHNQPQQQHIHHQQIMHQQQQTHLMQQQQQQQQQQQHQQQVQRQTPQPQQADQRLSPHQPHTQQQTPQHQQHVLLIDQQSQHSHHSTHSPVSNASSTSSQHHPENLVTVATTAVDNGTVSEMKSRIALKQEIMTEVEQQTQQQHQQQQQQQQQQMELEPDQSSMHGMVVTPEISGMMSQSQMSDIYQSDASEDSKVGILDGSSTQYTNLTSPNAGDPKTPSGPKTWTAEDMESALEALRTHNMSLTKASATYGIPSTTLWQRAHRLGIDTPKKEGPSKTWNEDSLNSALEALRTGTISANKASKAFGIPSSTLYKIARREGIRLAAPFNAAPTTWSAEDLDRALEAIRAGQTSVQKASTEFGIPTGTLYGRCKREGIELSRSNPTPWSEDAMMEALESVKQGHMSINQAAIHYNLPYSSLYGRFKRGKYDTPNSANPSHSNHGAGSVGGGGNIGGNVGVSAVTMAGVTSSPQMEFKIEPQHNEHSPENTVNYSYY
ncbi:AAEL017240-PA [Aedes aegypti]|uniref:AAEL017240-PA n=1 Tax=Aedes aegypti TaxID=7159 RepID=J9HIT3_AEDAE|nr:AAEL017240-PA [Aedes aegypti]